MPRRVACCLALVLSCCAIYCRHSRPRIEEPLPETPELRLELCFNARTRPFGNTRAEIIKNLGKPKLERTEKDLERAGQLTSEEKRYLLGHISEPINQIIELTYDGLLLRILKVNSVGTGEIRPNLHRSHSGWVCLTPPPTLLTRVHDNDIVALGSRQGGP